MKAKGKYVAGGDIHIKYASNKLKSKWSFWAGLGLILLVFAAAFVVPCPTDLQFLLFRFTMAIGFACLVSSLSGFIHFKKPEFEIGSGLLIFGLVFFIHPPNLIINNCEEVHYLNGQVYSDSYPLEGVMVMMPSQGRYSITNVQGDFNLNLSYGELKNPIYLQLQYQNRDTLIQLEKLNTTENLRINLK